MSKERIFYKAISLNSYSYLFIKINIIKKCIFKTNRVGIYKKNQYNRELNLHINN